MMVKKCAAAAFMAAVMSGCGSEGMQDVYQCTNQDRTGHAFMRGGSSRVELSRIDPSSDEYAESLAAYRALMKTKTPETMVPFEAPKTIIYSEMVKQPPLYHRASIFSEVMKIAKTYCATGITP